MTTPSRAISWTDPLIIADQDALLGLSQISLMLSESDTSIHRSWFFLVVRLM
jgi:hypothetical protein